MTYNVFGGTLNLVQSIKSVYSGSKAFPIAGAHPEQFVAGCDHCTITDCRKRLETVLLRRSHHNAYLI